MPTVAGSFLNYFLIYQEIIDYLLYGEQHVRYWDASKEKPGFMEFRGDDHYVYQCLEYIHWMTEGYLGDSRSPKGRALP